MDEQEISPSGLQEIVAVLLRHRQLILAVFVSGVLTAALLGVLRPPQYEASAKLMVTSERARITVSPDASAKPVIDRVTEEVLNSEVGLLESSGLIREVLDSSRDRRDQSEGEGLVRQVVAVLGSPLDLFTGLYRRAHGLSPLSPFEKWVRSTAERVTVTPVKRSSLIEVSFVDPDAEWAAEFVNKLVSSHVERHARMHQQVAAEHFYVSQRQLLNKKARAAEEALQRFYEREGIESLPDQREALGTRIAELESALASADSELAEGTARAAFLRKALQEQPKSILLASVAAQATPAQIIKTRILELQLQRSEMLSKFAPTSLRIQEIDRQVAEARQLLAQEEKAAGGSLGSLNPIHQTLQVELAQAEAQLAAVQGRAETLRGQIKTSRTRLAHLNEIAPEQERLEQQVGAVKEAFSTYLKKEEEARFANALDESRIVNVTIAEPAEVPAVTQPSKTLLILVLGAIMSLLAGVGLAFVRDRLDPTVKSAAEVHALTGLPILASIPSASQV